MDSFDDVVGRLRAAGEPTRLRILRLLQNGEFNVKDLTQLLGQSQPRVSRHIKLLAEAGLIERHQEGSWVFVRASADPERPQLYRGRAFDDRARTIRKFCAIANAREQIRAERALARAILFR